MRNLIREKQFKKDYKKVSKSGRHSIDDFLKVINLLIHDQELPEKYRDHSLIGDYVGFRECHIKPDWLLIYKKVDDNLILGRTGSHNELFN